MLLIFIEPPHFVLESHVSLWPILDGITFPLMSNFFGIASWFLCNILDNICEISGTILTLVLTNNYVNQFNATHDHKLHYKTKY